MIAMIVDQGEQGYGRAPNASYNPLSQVSICFYGCFKLGKVLHGF